MFSSNNNFKTTWPEIFKGAISRTMTSFSGSSASTLLSGLIDFKSQLLESVDSLQVISEGFTSSLPDFPDFEEGVIPNDITDDKAIIQLTAEQANLIWEALTLYGERYSYNFTLTDADGYGYKFSIRSSDVGSRYKTCVNYATDSIYDDYVWSHGNKAFFYATLDENNNIIGGTINAVLRSMGFVKDTVGNVTSFHNLLGDIIGSYQLNSMLIETIDALTSGATAFNMDIINSLRIKYAQISAVAQNFIDNLTSSFVNGGFLGVANYLLSFAKAQNTITTEDGRLVFTNNKNFVPQQYIVGLLSTVVNTVSQLASAVIALIRPGVGLAVSIIGTFVGGLIGNVKYDSDATKVGMNNNQNSCTPMTPWAWLQTTLTANHFPDLTNALKDYPLIMLNVPGGCLLVGAHSYSQNGSIQRIGVEFHASLANSISQLDNGTSLLRTAMDELFTFEVSDAPDWTSGWQQLHIAFDANDGFIELFERIWENVTFSPSVGFENSTNDRVSSSDDLLISRIICLNAWIFYMWCFGCAALSSTFEIDHTVQGIYRPMNGNSSGRVNGRTSVINSDWYELNSPFTSRNIIELIALLYPFQGTVTATQGGLITTDEYDGSILAYCSWSDLSSTLSQYAQNMLENYPWGGIGYCITDVFANKRWGGSAVVLSGGFTYVLTPAKYDSGTFLRWILLTSITAASVAALTVYIGFKASRWQAKKKALNAARVESAWNNLTRNPSDANYIAYRKAVRSNNRWSRIIGGTRFDLSNYWNTVDSTAPTTNNSGASNMSSLYNNYSNDPLSALQYVTNKLLNIASGTATNTSDLARLIELIIGPEQ